MNARTVRSQSLSLESLFIPGEGGGFFPSKCLCGHLRRFPREYYFRMVVITFRAGPAAECLIRSLFTPLKPGIHEPG